MSRDLSITSTFAASLSTATTSTSSTVPNSGIKLPKTDTLKPLKTKGGGDCGLHAALGEWDNIEQQVVCKDVPAYSY